MDRGNQASIRELVVRSRVELNESLVAHLSDRLTELLGEPVTITQQRDARVRGAVIYLDERRQVVIDTEAPLKEMQHRLERGVTLAGGGRRSAADVIVSQDDVPTVSVTDTNLKHVLDGMRGHRARLQVRVPVNDEVIGQLTAKLSAAAGREITVEMHVDPRPEASAILYLGEQQRIILDNRFAWVRDVTNTLERRRDSGFSPNETYEYIRSVIDATEPELRLEEVREAGRVLEVGDGIAFVSGMGTVGSQEVVEFENGAFGIAFSLLTDKVGCILLGNEDDIREGSGVRRTGHLLKVPVGPSLKGRIIDALGRPIDGLGPVDSDIFRPIERPAPGITDRTPVDCPLHTGIKVIDALVPLGRGQRELVIGDRKIGKTSIAIDTIMAQRGADVFCVYTSIGQKASSVGRIVHTLTESGAMEYSTLVVALPNEQPAFRHIAPYTACAIGEYVMDGGGHGLVVYDDLSKHATTYREMSALLKRPIGREAYPGDIFYVHSRLLERSARLSEERGGGSLTALPIVETLAGDISAFIPTNVISICDGQIVLDAGLFNEGIRPAMDVGLSVSRVGGSAQTKLVKQVAGRLRIDLAQYQEMAQFMKFGAEVDQATLDQLARGERCRELLKQTLHDPMPEAHEVLVLFAAVNGLLDDLPTNDLARFERHFVEHVVRARPGLIAALAKGARMDEALEAEVRAAVDESKGSFTVQVETELTSLGLADSMVSEEEEVGVAP